MKSAGDLQKDLIEAHSDPMDRRRFLKMIGAMAAILPCLGLPGFAESRPVQRTAGPPFSAVPFNPNLVTRTTVGSATLTFADASNGTFRYTVNGITQTKSITRLIFAAPATVCK